MNFEIFSYWNATELVTLFNAVAALTNSSNFLGLLKLFSIIALLSVAMVVIAGRGRMDDMWKWIILLTLFHGLLLVPKVTVVVVDRTSTSPNPQPVANVPIGIAALAGSVSKIGDFLTTSFETVFSLPNDVQFRKSGTLFGARVVREILMARSGSPVLSANMMDFIRECVYPEFVTGYVPPHELIRQPDIWAYLNGKTNIARYVEIREIPSGIMRLPRTCPEAYIEMTNQINTVVSASINDLGNALNPHVPLASRQALTQSQIMTAANLYTSISSAAPEIIRQGMVMNLFLDAQYKIPAQIGDAATATTALAEVQALRSTSESYKVMASVGQQVMPKMRNIIEMIQYALAPLALLIIVVLGQYGLGALGMYAKSLLWIQLWPPLYAVMNFIITMYSAKQADALANGGMSMMTYTYLNNLMISDQAIAGMIAAVGIPTISWMIVNGLALGASAFGNVLSSPIGAEAARFASAASQGNLNMGSLNVDNQSMGQYSLAPNTHVGAPIRREVGAHGITSTFTGDGHQAFDSSLIRHNTSMRLTFGERMASTFQQQSESAQTAATSDMATSAKLFASGLQQSFDFVRSSGASERGGIQTGSSSQIGFSQSVNEAREIVDNFAKEHGLNQAQGAEIIGLARTTLQSPKIIKSVLPLAAQAVAQVSGESSAQAQQTLKSAIGYLQKDGNAEALSRAEQAARNVTFNSDDESSRKAVDSIASNFNQSSNRSDSATAQYQRSESLREMAGKLKESSGSFEASMYHQFMEWMGTQRNPIDLHGRGFDGATVSQMAEKNPNLLVPFLDIFYKEKMESMVTANAPRFNSPEDIRHFFTEQAQMIRGSGSVSGWNGGGAAATAAAAVGLNPGDSVASSLPGKFDNVRERVIEAMDAGQTYLDMQGAPIKQEADKRTEPGAQPLMGTAISNTSGVLPDGVSTRLPSMPGATVPNAQQQRVNDGRPNNPVMDAIRELVPKVSRDKK
ncbi:MAG TPA: conjugal transfer protein TraG N-terminal domain-containing protein [Nitrosomonas mobilis]|nr:conjugal transfer protein TraG N-terminal domain-containing protein [Nitrosomonas mobilis]